MWLLSLCLILLFIFFLIHLIHLTHFLIFFLILFLQCRSFSIFFSILLFFYWSTDSIRFQLPAESHCIEWSMSFLNQCVTLKPPARGPKFLNPFLPNLVLQSFKNPVLLPAALGVHLKAKTAYGTGRWVDRCTEQHCIRRPHLITRPGLSFAIALYDPSHFRRDGTKINPLYLCCPIALSSGTKSGLPTRMATTASQAIKWFFDPYHTDGWSEI